MRTLSVFAGLLLVAGAGAASTASKLYKQGRNAERTGDMARAYLLYSQAAALAPEKPLYWQRSQAVRTRAALQAKPKLSVSVSATEDAPEPSAGIAAATAKDLAETRQPLPPKELKASSARKDFDLQGDAKRLFEQVARAFDLDCVFDGDYQAGRPFRFRMEQADYREALHALESATASFLVPLSDKLFLVVKDTEQKRREMEPSVTVTFFVPQAITLPELVEMVRAVQQTMNIEKVVWDSQKSTVVMRDRISRVAPALQILEDLLYHRPQVEMELEFIEMSRNDVLSYGLALPTSFPLVNLSTILHNMPSVPSALSRLMVLGGGKTMFGFGIANAEILARMSRGRGTTLLRAQLRSLDGQPATFHVGDKYPILTGGYFGAVPSTSGQFFAPPPSFTFEDLGLALKITPHIHGAEEVSLELEAEFKVLAGQSINDIPVISNRKINSKVRLKNGEWGVVAGMLTASEARSISGIAGLSSIPLLGPLVSRTTNTRDSSEVLVILKPRLVSLPPDQFVTRTVRVGAEARPLTPL